MPIPDLQHFSRLGIPVERRILLYIFLFCIRPTLDLLSVLNNIIYSPLFLLLLVNFISHLSLSLSPLLNLVAFIFGILIPLYFCSFLVFFCFTNSIRFSSSRHIISSVKAFSFNLFCVGSLYYLLSICVYIFSQSLTVSLSFSRSSLNTLSSLVQ